MEILIREILQMENLMENAKLHTLVEIPILGQ